MDPSEPTDAGDFAFPYIHPLNHLDAFIPAKVQRGLATVELRFSCIDVTSNYIAIGTTVGISYLFERRSGEIKKLRCDDLKTNAVTCIRCLETVELMVAMGMSTGVIAIFQMEKYSINDVHINPITYLEWSKNGMKLFSGDEAGVVAQTDLDFLMHLCKSTVLLREAHPIVQLVYDQRMLLVSSRQRTILCTTDNQIKQLGQRERKSLGNFGACFYTLPEKPNEMLVLASRPALRLWKANVDGKVLETFIFKDSSLQSRQILSLGSLLNLMPTSSSKSAEAQFGILRNFMDNYILTFNSSVLYLLAISEPTIVKKFEGLDSIVSVASNTDEIFVLSGSRCIIRISRSSDHTISQKSLIREESFLPSFKFMPSALKDLEYKLKGKSNLMTTSIFGMIKPIILNPTVKGFAVEPAQQNDEIELTANIIGAKVEPIEWPLILKTVNDDDNVSALSSEESVGAECPITLDVEVPSNSQLWAPLSDDNDEPDDDGVGIIFEQRVRKGHNKKKRSTNISRVHLKANNTDSSSADSADISCLEESRVVTPEFSKSESSAEKATAAISGLDLTSQMVASSNSREEKEILLAEMLGLKELLPEDHQAPKHDENDFSNCAFGASVITNCLQTNGDSDDIAGFSHKHELPDEHHVEAGADGESVQSNGSSLEFDIYRTNFSHCSNEDEDDDIPSQLNSECNSYLSYGPPSGSSNLNSMSSLGGRSLDPPLRPHSLSLHPPQTATKMLPQTSDSCRRSTHSLPADLLNSKVDQKTKMEVKYNDFWVQHKPPGQICSLAVCDHYIVCTDAKATVFYSSFDGLGLEWHRTEYLANQICISPSGKCVWRVHRNCAYALVEPSNQGPFGKHWVEVDLNVRNVSVTDTCVWYVTRDGVAFALIITDDARLHEPSPVAYSSNIAQVTCAESSVWAVTVDNALICRSGITAENPLGCEWTRVSFEAGTGNILAAELGMSGTVWIIDDASNIWFKSGLTPKLAPQGIDSKWWQVQIGDYVYQNVTTLQNITSTLIDSLNPEQLTSRLCRGNSCVVSTKAKGTWFYHAPNNQLFTNQSDIIGHRWSRINISISRMTSPKWKVMTASGVYRHHGGIFLWQPGSNIFCLNPTSMRGSHVRLPEFPSKENSLQCLSASPESLWLLTKSGDIFIRKDITAVNAGGNDWEKLDLEQIASRKLVHISCGSNLVWACDNKGTVLMRIGSLQAPSVHSLQPAWVIVDDATMGTSPQISTFVKVFVGPLDYTVWAVDSKNNIYVREGIFPELLIGLGWVPVAGIQATHLAISEHAVYALTPNRMIYRRYNISRNNYIGDYWMELPGLAEQISVTVDDKLWALNVHQQLIQHQEYTISGTGKRPKEKCATSPTTEQLYYSTNEDDWEMIESCS